MYITSSSSNSLNIFINYIYAYNITYYIRTCNNLGPPDKIQHNGVYIPYISNKRYSYKYRVLIDF